MPNHSKVLENWPRGSFCCSSNKSSVSISGAAHCVLFWNDLDAAVFLLITEADRTREGSFPKHSTTDLPSLISPDSLCTAKQ